MAVKLPIGGLLAVNVFLAGAAFAAMTPYRAIVGVDALGLSNATFGLVMAVSAVVSAFTAVVLGWLSDKVRDRRFILMACAASGILAFGLIWAFQVPLVFILLFVLLVPFSSALFSQSFSFSRAYFNRQNPERAEFTMSFLRSGFTLAWIIVPPIAGLVAAQGSAFSVFALSALAHCGCTLAIWLLWLQPGARIGTEGKAGGAADKAPAPRVSTAHKVGVAGVAFALSALQLNMVVLPMVIIRDLAGSFTQVGLISSVGALIEVPAMIGWGYLALRVGKETILAAASAIFALYFGLMSMAEGFVQVLMLQGIAALAIAALLSINISYLQEAIPGRLGLSTSLVDVTRVLSTWAAAAIFALNTGTTYAPLMVVACGLSLCGMCMLLAARRLRQRG